MCILSQGAPNAYTLLLDILPLLDKMNIISVSGLPVVRIVQSTSAQSKLSAGFFASLGVAVEDARPLSVLVDGEYGFATVMVSLGVDCDVEWDLSVGSDIGRAYDEMFRSRSMRACYVF